MLQCTVFVNPKIDIIIIIIIITIITALLLTLGSICSTNASGVEQSLKQIIQIKRTRVKNPTWPEANQLTSVYVTGQNQI